jgi:hypothetical protein
MKNLLILVFAISSLALAQQPTSSPEAAPAKSSPAASDSAPKKVDKAAAYYHFTMAHMYEEEMAAYGRSENVTCQQLKLAGHGDAQSPSRIRALIGRISRSLWFWRGSINRLVPVRRLVHSPCRPDAFNTLEHGGLQIGFSEIGASEVSICQIRAGELHTEENGAFQIGAL